VFCALRFFSFSCLLSYFSFSFSLFSSSSKGVVYAVEFSHRSGRDLINVAKKRTNVIPIIEDARLPGKYRMLVGMVDCVFADVAQPDQARIVLLNSEMFLKVRCLLFIVSLSFVCLSLRLSFLFCLSSSFSLLLLFVLFPSPGERAPGHVHQGQLH
jgi:hypothetical protein